MPLAEKACCVTDRFQDFSNRHLPQRHARGLGRAGANGVAAGQQRRGRHRAGELDVEAVEPQPFGSETIQARRNRAAHAAVDVDLAPPRLSGNMRTMLGEPLRAVGSPSRVTERQREEYAGRDRERPSDHARADPTPRRGGAYRPPERWKV